jgi:hypothetical protein
MMEEDVLGDFIQQQGWVGKPAVEEDVLGDFIQQQGWVGKPEASTIASDNLTKIAGAQASKRQLTMSELIAEGNAQLPENVQDPNLIAPTDSKVADLFMGVVGSLEGEVAHSDLGTNTTAYGLANDMSGNKAATVRNNAVAQRLFKKPLSDLSVPQLKQVVGGVATDIEQELGSKGSNFSLLSDRLKVLVVDGKYQTGVTFTKLMKAGVAYMDNPSKEALRLVVRESRRTVKGKHTRGMDNRVAKLLINLGFISSVEEAVALGLTKARNL